MTRSGIRFLFAAQLGLLLLLVAVVLATPTSSFAASRWAPESQATITPGVQMVTKGAQCTSNFVFTDKAGRVYVGYAAHCAGKGSSTDTNGCRTGSYPLGTPVTFERGGTLLSGGTVVGKGRLAYSSWVTERRLGMKRGNACAYNDLALVRLDPAYVGKVNPTVPYWGGPTGINTSGLKTGDSVYFYGNSSLYGGASQISPKSGISTGDAGNGWSHNFYTSPPGVPGDSGSGILDGSGRAVGVLSTIGIAPNPGENAAGDLGRELAFAQRYSGIAGLRMVLGTRGFSSS